MVTSPVIGSAGGAPGNAPGIPLTFSLHPSANGAILKAFSFGEMN